MSSTRFDHGYALIIGVGGNIPATVKDAEAIQDVFVDRDRAAYPPSQVLLLTNQNATRQGILAAFDTLIEQANQDSQATIVVYYSGHGARIKSSDEYFLIPHDWQEDKFRETAIAGSELTQKINAIQSQKLIVFLDCCHAGGMPKAVDDSNIALFKSAAPKKLMNALGQGSGRIIVASSKEEELSWTGESYSIFTTCLLEALQGEGSTRQDGYAHTWDVAGYLMKEVPERVKPKIQHPFINEVSNFEDFPLCRCSGNTEPPSTPLPQYNLEQPGGPLPIDSHFYKERSNVETESFQEIERPGALILVKSARQMGRTSLLIRLQNHAKKKGYRSVSVNFRLGNSERFNDISQFLQWFCLTIASELDIDGNIEDAWQSQLTDKQNCTNYFRNYIIRKVKPPILLGLDDVDKAFQNSDIAIDFLSMLRVWYEKARSGNKDWQKLRIVINYISDQHLGLDNYQSPFNVGKLFELPEFTAEDIQELAEMHGLNLTNSDIDQLLKELSGHPHLVRIALYSIAKRRLNISRFFEIAKSPESPYLLALRREVRALTNERNLVDYLSRVLESADPVELESSYALPLLTMGLVKFDKAKDDLIPLCGLYRDLYKIHFMN